MPRDTTAAAYLWAAALDAGRAYVLQDLGRALLYTKPFVRTRGREGTRISDMRGLERMTVTLAMGCGALAIIVVPYSVVCMVGMASRCFWTEPHHNHAVFGRWSGCWTI